MAQSTLELVLKARDEASDKMLRARQQTSHLQQGITGLNRAFLALGLGAFGVSQALRFVVGRADELEQQTVSMNVLLQTLPDNIVSEFNRLKDSGAFAALAGEIGKTEHEVELMFLNIARHSQGVEPSIDSVASAFGIVKSGLADAGSAAQTTGGFLAGAHDEVIKLGGGMKDGKTVMDAFADAARDSATDWDNAKRIWKDVGDWFARNGKQILIDLAQVFDKEEWKKVWSDVEGFFTKTLPDWVKTGLETVEQWVNDFLIEPFQNALDLLNQFLDTLPSWLDPRDWFGGNSPAATNTRSPASVNVTINNPVIDNEVRQAEMARQITREIRTNLRAGGSLA